VADVVSRDSRIAEASRKRNALYTAETSSLDLIRVSRITQLCYRGRKAYTTKVE